MVIDCHVHISCICGDGGSMSAALRTRPVFRFMRWRLGIEGEDEPAQQALEKSLADTVQETPELDAVVVLAFDAPHHPDGRRDEPNTHLYVSNRFVHQLCQRWPKLLFGASVHPYRPDALRELEWCIQNGAVLCKWLPLTQNINPADRRCFRMYEMLAQHGVPLLSHTGWEQALPTLDPSVADPRLLKPALQRGVKVIAAHCGTRSLPVEEDFLPAWAQMVREHENLWGDTAALSMPNRWYAWAKLLEDPLLRSRLVHGSDWPIPAFPPARLGPRAALQLMREKNWLRRDVLIKQRLGLGEDYWRRAASILRLHTNAE